MLYYNVIVVLFSYLNIVTKQIILFYFSYSVITVGLQSVPLCHLVVVS